MANQLSFENDPLVVWYVCDDGDIDYNQADVVYYVKYKKSSKGVNKSVSELFYTNVNETGTDEEERTERNDNDITQITSGNPNLDRILYKHMNNEEYKEVIL
jgi:hypothetical protein